MADKLYFSRDTEVYLQMTADHGGGTGGTVWKIPVLDGFSFSQATNASEITLSEAVSNNSARGKSRRSRQMFNDSYAPAEWSFSTYMRPFKSAVNASNGWSPTGTSADVHSVEEALWANFVSNPSFTRGVSGTDAAWTAPNPHASSGNINPVKNDVNFKLINFKSSEVAALGEFDLYFKLGGTSGQIVGTASTQLNYRIADCVVNEVTIDFDIDGIATLNWSGMGRIITEEASTPSTNLISEGADEFAIEQGLDTVDNSYFITERRRTQLLKNKTLSQLKDKKESSSSISKFGTVGCVALDKKGNLSAGTSTGGRSNKKWGRVGDVPIIGAGNYANNKTCAISATGWGEFFIRNVVAHDISSLLEYKNLDIRKATKLSLDKVRKLGGSGGVIALDKFGNYAMEFNTKGMYRGVKDSKGNFKVSIFKND